MKRIIITFTAICILAALAVVPAGAVEWKMGSLSIPASALLPRDNSIIYETNGIRMNVPGLGDNGFLAPVFLPQYSYIYEITQEAYDPSGGEFGGHIVVELLELQYNTFRVLAHLDTGSAAAPGDTRIVDFLGHLVNNEEFSYGVSVVINNGNGGPWNQMFYKIIIKYAYPDLPL